MVHAQDSHQADGQWPVLDALVDRVLDARRQIAAAQAAEAQLLAEAVTIIADRTDTLRQHASQAGRTYTSTGDLPLREVSLELGAAMRVSDRTVQARISDAHALTTDFPATFAALSTGQIDAGHAWAIVRSGIGLTDEVRAAATNDWPWMPRPPNRPPAPPRRPRRSPPPSAPRPSPTAPARRPTSATCASTTSTRAWCA
ncbi:DUF222 domain-containing protein [Microbacterium lacticum]